MTTNRQRDRVDEHAKFYVLFRELSKSDPNLEQGYDLLSDEIDEIDQVVRAVADIEDEPPQFSTST